jgi:hypothetical protein
VSAIALGQFHILLILPTLSRRTYILLVPKKPPKPMRHFHVGDHVKVNPHRGGTVDAVIRAVTTDQRGRVRLQVEFGKDKTAYVYDWQVCD